jgi:hypothetical protein
MRQEQATVEIFDFAEQLLRFRAAVFFRLGKPLEEEWLEKLS